MLDIFIPKKVPVNVHFWTTVFRLEKYIDQARDNLGLDILPTNSFKSFIFSFTRLDKTDPERKFLCEISLDEPETGGKKKYSGTFPYETISIFFLYLRILKFPTLFFIVHINLISNNIKMYKNLFVFVDLMAFEFSQ